MHYIIDMDTLVVVKTTGEILSADSIDIDFDNHTVVVNSLFNDTTTHNTSDIICSDYHCELPIEQYIKNYNHNCI